MGHNPNTTHRYPDGEKFLMAALCLALVGTIEGDEPQRTARWNRARQAHDPIIRLCDTYLPEMINDTALNKVWDVIDLKVIPVIKRNKNIFADAIYGEADRPCVGRDEKGRWTKL